MEVKLNAYDIVEQLQTNNYSNDELGMILDTVIEYKELNWRNTTNIICEALERCYDDEEELEYLKTRVSKINQH